MKSPADPGPATPDARSTSTGSEDAGTGWPAFGRQSPSSRLHDWVDTWTWPIFQLGCGTLVVGYVILFLVGGTWGIGAVERLGLIIGALGAILLMISFAARRGSRAWGLGLIMGALGAILLIISRA